MIFNHNFLPKLNIQKVDTPDGRFYVTPDGNHYQSVTTLLSKNTSNDIIEWKNTVGEKESNRIVKHATDRGTALHNGLEQFLLNQTPNITNFFAKAIFKPFSKILEENVDNIRALEYPLYSDIMKLGGTIDLCADWKLQPAVIDFKSSNKLKNTYEIKNYFIQASMYSYMIEERYELNIPNIVILVGAEFSNFIQVFEEHRANFKNDIVKLLKN